MATATKSGRRVTYEQAKEYVESRGYTLLSTTYVNAKTPLKMLCPNGHDYDASWHTFKVRGLGCKKCAAQRREDEKKRAKTQQVEKSFREEGYTPLSEYKNNTEKMHLLCPEEHDCYISWRAFNTSGVRCQICWEERRGDANRTDIEEVRKYTASRGYKLLSKTFKNTRSKLKFECPKGDVFEMTWGNFKNSGAGCPYCAGKRVRPGAIEQLAQQRGVKVLSCNYENCYSKIKIQCPKGEGHIYDVSWTNFQQNSGCPYCAKQRSAKEKEIVSLYSCLNLVENNRTIIGPKELDLYFPDHKVAVEYNGLFWHSDEAPGNRITPSYHRDKLDQCAKQNIRLLTIFEDEWLNHRDICVSRINSALGLIDNKIYARSCEARQIPKKEAKEFLTQVHLQGYGGCKVAFGLYYKGKLVQVMTFGFPARAHTAKGKKVLEMKRLASALDTIVVGGAGKLFKLGLEYAKKEGYDLIKSYCDLRWGTGNLYKKLGFKKTYETKYTPHYTDGVNRYRNQRLAQNKSKTGITEAQSAIEKGLWKIYDCGHSTWEYKI